MFNNIKALVTGSDGFIGSHLVEKLVSEGAKVRCLVMYNPNNSWGWLDSLSVDTRKQIEVFAGDIRDHGFVRNLVEGQDLVFHLAALISIPYSYVAPSAYIQTNVIGTHNVLEACHSAQTPRLLVTSTSEVYGSAAYAPIDEKHPLRGQSPYSATKIAADKLAESYHRSFDLPVVTVRPFNTYGPRQSARAIIPTVVSQLLGGSETIKMGSLTPTRDLVFVEDTVMGFLKLAEADAAIGQEVNIATNSEIAMGDLVDKIMQISGVKGTIELDEERIRPVNSEVTRLIGDNTKLKSLTGWVPSISLDHGLEQTTKWFMNKHNLANYKSTIYNI